MINGQYCSSICLLVRGCPDWLQIDFIRIFTWYAEVATPQTNPSGKVSYKRGSSYSNCPIARGRRAKSRHSFANILSYVNRLYHGNFETEKGRELLRKREMECEVLSNMLWLLLLVIIWFTALVFDDVHVLRDIASKSMMQSSFRPLSLNLQHFLR